MELSSGESVITVALTNTRALSIVYKGTVLDESSSLLTANRADATAFKYHLYSYKLVVRTGEPGSTAYTYNLPPVSDVPEVHTLYFSSPDSVSAGGQATGIRIVGKYRYFY